MCVCVSVYMHARGWVSVYVHACVWVSVYMRVCGVCG